MSVFSTRRYVELKSHVLGILYQEALQSFAAGSRAAADLVQAFEMRHISITATMLDWRKSDWLARQQRFRMHIASYCFLTVSILAFVMRGLLTP
jgi:hypothetical protein